MHNVIALPIRNNVHPIALPMDLEQFVHDIKSPLSALKLFLEQFPQNDILPLTHMAVDRIHDLLKKLEPQKNDVGIIPFQENKSICSLNKVIYEVILEKSCELSFPIGFLRTPESDAAEVLTQRFEFKRVLSNIINNAFDAVESDGSISLQSYCQNGQFILEIQDNGKGIKREQIKEVFEHGYSNKNSTGLGLHHALQRVREWNGQINILSRENCGTTVVISLPLYPTSKPRL